MTRLKMIANRLLLNRLARVAPVNAHIEDDAYNKRARNNAELTIFDKEPAISSEKEAKMVIANKMPFGLSSTRRKPLTSPIPVWLPEMQDGLALRFPLQGSLLPQTRWNYLQNAVSFVPILRFFCLHLPNYGLFPCVITR